MTSSWWRLTVHPVYANEQRQLRAQPIFAAADIVRLR